MKAHISQLPWTLHTKENGSQSILSTNGDIVAEIPWTPFVSNGEAIIEVMNASVPVLFGIDFENVHPEIKLDPIKREWLILDLGNDGTIQIHPYYDFARNLELAELFKRAIEILKSHRFNNLKKP
jgi:hypothetical protein